MDQTDEYHISEQELEDILTAVKQDPESIDSLSSEQLQALERKLNPYGATIVGDNKYTALSFTNLREEYMKRLLLTALVGYSYQMVDEWECDLDELESPPTEEDFKKVRENPDRNNEDLVRGLYERKVDELIKEKDLPLGEELGEEEMLEVSAIAKKHVDDLLAPTTVIDQNAFAEAQDKAIQEQSIQERAVIKRWMDRTFKYDPRVHAKNSFNKQRASEDPERTLVTGQFATNVPEDFISSFKHFMDINYEPIRDAVKYLYDEKPDLEVAINVYGVFDTLEECNDFVEKNKNKVMTDVLTLTNNKWNLVGPFKENRERMNFYNKNTQVLENMLKKREEDAKIGKELLRNRVRKKKVKNVRQYGKDHPSFLEYKKQVDANLVAEGDTITISEDGETMTVEQVVEIAETGATVDNNGIPEDSLQVDVIGINAGTGEINKNTIYTKAEAPQGPPA